jgi:hypothetical protein
VGHLSIRYDMRGEFADAKVNDITFVDQELPGAAPAVLLDLKAALQASTDLAARPTREDGQSGRACTSSTGTSGKRRLGEALRTASRSVAGRCKSVSRCCDERKEIAIGLRRPLG